MAEFETVDYSKLNPLNLALTNFFAHSLPNGKLYRSTIGDFASFVAPYVSEVGASGFVEVSGNILPDVENETAYTFVPVGVYDQSTAGNITANGDINI